MKIIQNIAADLGVAKSIALAAVGVAAGTALVMKMDSGYEDRTHAQHVDRKTAQTRLDEGTKNGTLSHREALDLQKQIDTKDPFNTAGWTGFGAGSVAVVGSSAWAASQWTGGTSHSWDLSGPHSDYVEPKRVSLNKAPAILAVFGAGLLAGAAVTGIVRYFNAHHD